MHLPATEDHLPTRWQRALASARKQIDMLPHPLSNSSAIDHQPSFPFFVTDEFAQRASSPSLDDPLWRQVVPRLEETQEQVGFGPDPVGDEQAEVLPGLLHKYHGRVLLVLTGACAIHCRYCFRRHFPYESVPKATQDWEPALQYLSDHDEVQEVILSGGDPLMVVDPKLRWLSERLNAILHLKRLRIHTRMPVVLPARVNEELIEWLSESRLSKWIVIHANHALELDQSVADAMQRLQGCGAHLLNQSVLLAGVNDSSAALADLSLRLLDIGVLPYYLHQLDRVQGATHFEVPVERGLALMEELKALLPGYAIPRYVCERPGEPSKSWLD